MLVYFLEVVIRDIEDRLGSILAVEGVAPTDAVSTEG